MRGLRAIFRGRAATDPPLHPRTSHEPIERPDGDLHRRSSLDRPLAPVGERPHRFTEEQLSLARRHHVPASLLDHCARIDDSSLRLLGTGGTNPVFTAIAVPPDGSPFEGVYKAETFANFAYAHDAGIAADHQDWAMRNLATVNVDRFLWGEAGVIPRTHLALRGNEFGCIMQRAGGISPVVTGSRTITVGDEAANALSADAGLLDDFAQSKGFSGVAISGRAVTLKNQEIANEIDFGNSLVRRELTRLQWLDALTGQCDRNLCNYFVQVGSEGADVRVWGIDNDIAFGTTVTRPDGSLIGFAARLPRVIDRVTYTRLFELTPEVLAGLCPGRSAAEIAAAQSRLAAIKAHLQSTDVRVLEMSQEWKGPEVEDALGIVDFSDEDRWLSQEQINNALMEARQTSYLAYADAYQQAVALRVGYPSAVAVLYKDHAIEDFVENRTRRGR
jgi:hypothetical protein